MEENNGLQRITTPGLEDLNEKERLAVEMRYLGKTSQEIADATGYNENYVRNLFMQGGRLAPAYSDFARIQRDRAQETVDIALNRARDEALGAIERIISLSKEACNEAAILKANEFLLNVAGIHGQLTLRSFFQGKSDDHAFKIMSELFKELYGKDLMPDVRVIITTHCPKCDPISPNQIGRYATPEITDD
ncbi:MAG: hypothetical protein WC352_02465 [Candidatus Omnitrophota bacterium]